MTNQQKIDMFLDYCNNFMTVARFAEYYALTLRQAENVINNGRILHNASIERQRGSIAELLATLDATR
tara:strand:- start:117 stop:320 length:204 start_codon:yes stop_codon:yes gene_type:complete